jgi:signal transduction histidine kinase
VSVVAVLWRARHPLGMLLVAFGAQTLAGVGPALAGLGYVVPYTTAVVLLFPYSLARWGSGRQVVAGAAVLVATHMVRETLDGEPTAETVAGAGFLLFAVALGAAVRFWGSAHRREVEQVRLRERARLARELHDTVAHHVSGIVVQAQAGLVVGASDPGRSIEVLRVIEEAARRTLTDMRSLVGVLRDGEPAERAPVPGVAEVAGLASSTLGGPRVHVEITGDVGDVDPSVSATVFRVAQESVTNARWHARDATRVDVRVRGEDDAVHVAVVDAGTGRGGSSARGPGSRHGITGMRERVEALGGHLDAGPRPGGGWAVAVSIPRAARR